MTAALSQQTVTVKDPAAIRKRRRRAPTGGASDDCFTCAKRNVKCDRRRPYCSQCLEVGNECSGYKTQLTWGVGVASRGKLRGLSLPVAKSPPVAREPKKTSTRARAHSNASTASNASRWMDQEEMRRSTRGPIDIPALSQHHHSNPPAPYQLGSYDYLGMPHHAGHPAVHHQAQPTWDHMQYSPGAYMTSPEQHKYSRYPVSVMTDGLSTSMDSAGSHMEYLSPISQSYPREELNFVGSPSLMYDGYSSTHQSSPAPHSPPTGLMVDHSQAPLTSCPSLVYAPSETGSSLGSQMDPFESHLSQKMMRQCSNMSEPQMMPLSAYTF